QLHTTNAVRLSITTDEALMSYLRIFCEFVHGENGPFHIVESESDLHFADDGALRELQDAGLEFSPMERLADTEQGLPQFRVWVAYGDMLFKAFFAVPQNGVVEMIDDEQVAAGIPILLREYDGALRTVPKTKQKD
uniref:hypothetical protein n=1 Tax=Pseudophaeobacter sp. TaxID=1971739 RepID=UPI002632F79C